MKLKYVDQIASYGSCIAITEEDINLLINQRTETILLSPSVMWSFLFKSEPLKPGDLKKNYEPGINRGNIAYETFCKHMERWLQNGTLKIGNKS